MIDREIAIKIAPRGDGGIHIWSDDMPGLVLSGADPVKVMGDLWPAIKVLSEYKRKQEQP